MSVNIVSYLGLLGFLGFLGFPTANAGFFGFFGFFGFLSALTGRGGDERVDLNINRASRNAFVLITLTLVFSLVYVIMLGTMDAFPTIFAILFIVDMIAFVISYIYYDYRGD